MAEFLSGMRYVKQIYRLMALPAFFPLAVLVVGIALSIPRMVTPDEPWYLHDIGTIAQTFAEGRWIGNENVGWHGFLFKIPAALVLMLTGPSVFAATSVYVIYAVCVCYLLRRFLARQRIVTVWIVCGMLLFVTSRHFLLTLPTVLCDMPVVLAALLLYWAIVSRANRWVIGLALLLILDAKEGVFFAFVPAIAVWAAIEEIAFQKGVCRWRRMRELCARWTAYFLPATAFLVLMFTSGIVPLNMRNANILGLTTTGFHDMLFNFNPRHMSINLQYRTTRPTRVRVPEVTPVVSNILEIFRSEDVAEETNAFLYMPSPTAHVRHADIAAGTQRIVTFGARTLTFAMAYVRKIFHWETFSFLSVPFYIIVPAIIMTWKVFRRGMREKSSPAIALVLLTWTYLFVYCSRVSSGRYLLPIVPLLIYYFCLYLEEAVRHRRFAVGVFISVVVFILVSMLFEIRYVGIKWSLHLFLLSVYGIATYMVWRDALRGRRAMIGYCVALAAVCLGVAGASMLIGHGQIGRWARHGYNNRVADIVPYIPTEGRVCMLGVDTKMIQFYLGDPVPTAEHTWRVHRRFPKAHLQRRYSPRIRSYRFRTYARLRDNLLRDDVTWLVWAVRSERGTPDVVDEEWVTLDEVHETDVWRVYRMRVERRVGMNSE